MVLDRDTDFKYINLVNYSRVGSRSDPLRYAVQRAGDESLLSGSLSWLVCSRYNKQTVARVGPIAHYTVVSPMVSVHVVCGVVVCLRQTNTLGWPRSSLYRVSALYDVLLVRSSSLRVHGVDLFVCDRQIVQGSQSPALSFLAKLFKS